MKTQPIVSVPTPPVLLGEGPLSSRYVKSCSIPLCALPVKSLYDGIPFCHRHFHREYMRTRRAASPPTDARYFLGAHGEAAIRAILLGHGRAVEDQAARCKFDFLVDGWRVEVKTVNPWRARPGWLVNFQRNGILDEQTDFYVVRLESPYDPIHILLRAPIGKKGLHIRRGPELWKQSDDFKLFARGGYGQKPVILQRHLFEE